MHNLAPNSHAEQWRLRVRAGAPIGALLCLALMKTAHAQTGASVRNAMVDQVSKQAVVVPRSTKVIVAESDFVYLVDATHNRIQRVGLDGASRSWKLSAVRGKPIGGLLVAGVTGDTLWTWDSSDERGVLMDPDGRVVARERWEMPPPRAEGTAFIPVSMPRAGRGTVAEIGSATSMPFVEVAGRLILETRPERRPPDTLLVLRSEGSVLQLEGADGRVTTSQQPWVAVDLFAASTDGECAAAVLQNMPIERPRDSVSIVRWYGRESARRRMVQSYHFVPTPLDGAQVDRFTEAIVRTPFGRAFSTPTAARRSIGEAMTRPASLPPVLALLLESDPGQCRLWLQDGTDPEGRNWTILVKGAKEEWRVHFPKRVELRGVARKRAWGTITTPTDMAILVVYEVRLP
jgi:hypothetical protein